MQKRRKVLVTGACGQLGSEIRRLTAGRRGFVFTDCIAAEGILPLDICDADAVSACIVDNSVGTIINCAAYTNVEKAEDELEFCRRIIDIHATGNVKLVSIIAGTVLISVPFVTYLLFYMGMNVKTAFILIIIANAFLCLTNVVLVRYYCGISITPFVNAIVRVLVTSALALALCLFIKTWIPPTRIHMITNSAIAFTTVVLFYFVLCFDREQRQFAIGFIKMKLHMR